MNNIEEALARIAEIDHSFKTAVGWGSWMVAAANERERLVNYLNEHGVKKEHKYLARTGSGGKVD